MQFNLFFPHKESSSRCVVKAEIWKINRTSWLSSCCSLSFVQQMETFVKSSLEHTHQTNLVYLKNLINIYIFSYFFSHSLTAVVRTCDRYIWWWEVYSMNIWRGNKFNSCLWWSCGYNLHRDGANWPLNISGGPSQSLCYYSLLSIPPWKHRLICFTCVSTARRWSNTLWLVSPICSHNKL